MNDIAFTAIFFLIMLLSVGLIVLTYWRARYLARQWAEAQGYELIAAEQRIMFRGPFFFSAKGQIVYRITVRDDAGREHNGWLRCGGYWLGVLTDNLLGLFDLFTAEAHRREGHATAVLDYILAWGFKRGAASAFLQVHSENSAAQTLYRSFGFDVAYPYWYRIERRNPDPSGE